jgi:hypothetical protein
MRGLAPSRQALDASAPFWYPRLSRSAASRVIPLQKGGALTGFPAHWRAPSKVACATSTTIKEKIMNSYNDQIAYHFENTWFGVPIIWIDELLHKVSIAQQCGLLPREYARIIGLDEGYKVIRQGGL